MFLVCFIWLGEDYVFKAMLIVLQHVDMVIRYVGVFLIKHLYLNGVCEECAPHKRHLKEIVFSTLHLIIVNKIWRGGRGPGNLCVQTRS